MAERQQPFLYSQDRIDSLERVLSRQRFSTYLKAAGFCAELAFELYLYNARLAKAFLFPLHVMEVLLRNAVDEVLSNRFTPDWHLDPRLRRTLTAESQATLIKAVARATKNDNSVAKDDVVSRLTFDFWSNLFRPHYDRPIWQTGMTRLLPNAQAMTRARFKPLVMSINQFRNRIAHHEPIFALNVSNQYKDILTAIGYRSGIAALWLKKHATVNPVMRTRPIAAHAGMLAVISDNDFICLEQHSTLCALVGSKPKFIIGMDGHLPSGAMDQADLGRYLLENVDDSGLIDFSEHSIKDVLIASKGLGAFRTANQWQTINDAMLRGPARFILIVDDSRKILGVVAKAAGWR